MSAGFRRPDSRGRLLVPAAVALRNNTNDKTRGQSSSNRISGGTKLLTSAFSSNSPKYQRLRLKEEKQHQQQTYVFGHVDTEEEDDEEIDDDEEEIEVFELPEIRSRRNQGGSKKSDSLFQIPGGGGLSKISYLQHQVTNGDTVQSLSIKYACPISELKRINHLIRDQDLFGLKHVKVPIKKYGIISENCGQGNLLLSTTDETPLSENNCMGRQEESHINKCDTWTETDSELPLNSIGEDSDGCNLSDPDTQRRVIQTLSIKDMMQSQTKEAKEFLRNMDRDLEILRESTRTNRHSLDEVISVLTNKSIHPLDKGSGRLLCSGEGADCGLRYKNIVAAVLTIAVAIPLLLLIYFKFIVHTV